MVPTSSVTDYAAAMVATYPNYLYYGDCLDILKKYIPDNFVDLIYLDPPFNSNRTYNILFRQKTGEASPAQIEAFDDSWTWTQEAEAHYQHLQDGAAPPHLADALEGLRRLLGQNDVMAYLIMMAARLVEMYRVLKATGTLYLHCDPTASHYLKVLLDALFGVENFGNEIIWVYKYGGRSKDHFGRKHDTIFRYMKSKKFTFNSSDPKVRIPHEGESLRLNFRYVDEEGRRYREGTWSSGKKYRYYADEGRLRDDVWTDINALHQADAERLGYPTQKPLALLELIAAASSNEGDLVLDPFCGCGTTIAAAQNLKRRWIGIDITYLAVDLIDKRLQAVYGNSITDSYKIVGIPRDLDGAHALFTQSPFEFERWVVSLVNGQPNQKQVGDRGIDGVLKFPTGRKGTDRILVSVKGGKQLSPTMVRDLIGTVNGEKAAMGLLITLEEPTRGMVQAANQSGLYYAQAQGVNYPTVQIVTVSNLLAGKKPMLPPTLNPYIEAKRMTDVYDQFSIDDLEG